MENVKQYIAPQAEVIAFVSAEAMAAMDSVLYQPPFGDGEWD